MYTVIKKERKNRVHCTQDTSPKTTAESSVSMATLMPSLIAVKRFIRFVSTADDEKVLAVLTACEKRPMDLQESAQRGKDRG